MSGKRRCTYVHVMVDVLSTRKGDWLTIVWYSRSAVKTGGSSSCGWRLSWTLGMSKDDTYRDYNKNLGDYEEDGLEMHGRWLEETDKFEKLTKSQCLYGA